MSILQNYERHINLLGCETIEAIFDYCHFLEKDGSTIFYSDIIYKKEEWQKFENWRKTIYNKNYGRGSKRDRDI